MNELPAKLTAFFGEMVPYLDGKAGFQELEGRLGPGRGGRARFEFYRQLMAANLRRILEHLYPATRALLGPSAWAEEVAAYNQDHRSAAWNLNRHGEAFAAFLASRHPTAAELADLEWLEYELTIAVGGFEPERDRLNANVAVRLYQHRVDLCLGQLRRGEPVLPARPEPVTLLVYRRPDHRIGLCQPTQAMLLAYGLRTGATDRAALKAAGIEAQLLEEGELALARLGIFGSPR